MLPLGDLDIEKDPVGVEECDQYVHLVNACLVPRLPETSRDDVLGATKQARLKWTAQAQADRSPAGQERLREECRRATQEATGAFQDAGCAPTQAR